MLIYARNHMFYSKSENKVPRILIFGVNILCSIPNNVLEKSLVSYVSYFLCILLFYEFLVYFFVTFSTFCFCYFFSQNLSQNLFQA